MIDHSIWLGTLIVLLMGMLNRVRGGGWNLGWHFDKENPNKLPGRALYYVAVVVGIIAAFWSGSSWTGLAYTIGYLVWGVFPWGFLFGLGRMKPTDRNISKFEKTLLTLAFDNAHLAFWLRHLLIGMPLVLMSLFTNNFEFVVITPIMSMLVVGSYEIGWQVFEMDEPTTIFYRQPIFIGETLTGLLWGLMIVST